MEIYLNAETYHRLVAALAAIPVDPASSPVDRADAVRTALGLVGDVWPSSIAADAMTEHLGDVSLVACGPAPTTIRRTAPGPSDRRQDT